jgi:hypothetical protein
METNYDVQTIKAYFTNKDIETLVDGLIRKEDGSFDLGATINISQKKIIFENLLSYLVPFLQVIALR